MADFDFGEGLRKVFLAGVGALATTVEKGQEIVDDLVKKGELTVEQGKALNTELKRKAEEEKKEHGAKPDQPEWGPPPYTRRVPRKRTGRLLMPQ